MCGLGALFSGLGFAAAGSSTTGAGLGGLTLPLEVTTRLGASAAGAAAGGGGSTAGGGSVGDGASAATGASAAGAAGTSGSIGASEGVSTTGSGVDAGSSAACFGSGFFDETALAAGFLAGGASGSGWASRISPSRSAFRRTRSAWASTMLEE